MCMFTQPVISVSNTKMFGRKSVYGTQYLVYQMTYESMGENAMILPLPVKQPARTDDLRFIDLSDYSRFFDDLDKAFPSHSTVGIGCSSGSSQVKRESLEVFEIGNYMASFVSSFSDFDRLAPVFKFPPSVWSKIPDYENFSFAVFQLASGRLQPHPMALEFRTESAELFFPTIHIHDGEVHDKEDFDHVIYMQHAGLDSKVREYLNSNVEDDSTQLVRSQSKALQCCDIERAKGIVLGDLLLHRKHIVGHHPNVDAKWFIQGDPVIPAFNLRPFYSSVQWILPAIAIGWLFKRRARLRRESNTLHKKDSI